MAAQIIAITGRSGVGKTTAANFYHQQLGAVVLSFADPLRHMLAAQTGIPAHALEIWRDKDAPLTVAGESYREAMRRLGAELLRTDSAALIRLLFNKLADLDDAQIAVIPDVRTREEIREVRDAGALVIHIRSTRIPPQKSRTEMLYPVREREILLANNGTRDQFLAKLRHSLDLPQLKRIVYNANQSAGAIDA